MKNNNKNKNQIGSDSWETVGSSHSISLALPGLYLCAVAIILLVADVFGLPPYQALGLGFLLGFAFSFRSVGKIRREFDLRSLLILFLLVGITAAVATIVQPQLKSDRPASSRGNTNLFRVIRCSSIQSHQQLTRNSAHSESGCRFRTRCPEACGRGWTGRKHRSYCFLCEHSSTFDGKTCRLLD